MNIWFAIGRTQREDEVFIEAFDTVTQRSYFALVSAGDGADSLIEAYREGFTALISGRNGCTSVCAKGPIGAVRGECELAIRRMRAFDVVEIELDGAPVVLDRLPESNPRALAHRCAWLARVVEQQQAEISELRAEVRAMRPYVDLWAGWVPTQTGYHAHALWPGPCATFGISLRPLGEQLVIHNNVLVADNVAVANLADYPFDALVAPWRPVRMAVVNDIVKTSPALERFLASGVARMDSLVELVVSHQDGLESLCAIAALPVLRELTIVACPRVRDWRLLATTRSLRLVKTDQGPHVALLKGAQFTIGLLG